MEMSMLLHCPRPRRKSLEACFYAMPFYQATGIALRLAYISLFLLSLLCFKRLVLGQEFY